MISMWIERLSLKDSEVEALVTTVLDYLEDTEKRFPDKTAFEDAEISISYSMLAGYARSAGTVIAGKIRPNNAVAVCMKKGAKDIAAFMGAVYAGCFYVPIDVQMPPERIALILDVLKPGVVICDDTGAKSIGDTGYGSCEILLFDEIVKEEADVDKLSVIRSNMKNTDLLYVLFTSGSTGVPKGVTISQGALIDMTEWLVDKYEFTEDCSFCSQVPFYFDVSVPDIYVPMKTGGTTYIPPKSYYTFPKKVLQYIKEKNINTLSWVPSAMINVVRAGAFEVCVPDCIKLVLFCGEVMPCKYLNEWRRRIPEALYVNMYGPTEACYACTYYDAVKEFPDDGVLPLGRACENSTVVIISEDNKLCAQGEQGELCILGQCLSYGYYNSPEKTKKAFVQNPLNDKYAEPMYRTGDLACVNEDGELMYIGRMDSQIKRLGHRIELGEIEHAILGDKSVETCCCIYNEESSDIIALYCGDESIENLGAMLSQKLPSYMHPTKYIKIDSMPLNLNGKIDRAKLKKEYGGA